LRCSRRKAMCECARCCMHYCARMLRTADGAAHLAGARQPQPGAPAARVRRLPASLSASQGPCARFLCGAARHSMMCVYPPVHRACMLTCAKQQPLTSLLHQPSLTLPPLPLTRCCPRQAVLPLWHGHPTEPLQHVR
jgi:hypothetical protein